MEATLVPLDLFVLLKRLGTPQLSELVGNDRLQAIAEIFSGGITETKLVEFLKLRYGTQLLANKDIRTIVVTTIPKPYLAYILDGIYREDRVLDKNDLNKLLSFNWSRNSALAKRTVSIFNLGLEYLPPVPQKNPSSETIEPEIFLYPYQLRLKDRLVRSLLKGDERLLVHMPTGAGKTRTCIEAIVDYWRSFADRSGYVVWLAHSEELCEQAVETFKKIWRSRGDTSIEVYRLWGGHETPDFTDRNGFIVASLQRLHSMRITADNKTFQAIAVLKSKCRMIVVDEAHKCIAPTYKAGIEFISNIKKTKIIGLTATPGRGGGDSETQELARFFYKNKITLTSRSGVDIDNPIKYLQNDGYLARVVRRVIASNVTIDLNEKEQKFVATFLDIPTSVLNKLAKDAERNALILGEIAALCAAGRNVIVFALSVEHAHLLTELLNMKDVNSRCVDGTCSSQDRQRYIKEYKLGEVRVLVNYGVLTTGFDAPNTNAVIIARPTGSLVLYSQMIGRGIRGPKMGGNENCILVDIKDNLIGFPDERQAFTFFDSEWT